MEITSHLPPVATSQVPLEKLAGSKSVSESDKVAEMSRQFEAVLVRQILTDAQKPTFKSKLNPENTATSIHRDMMVNTMADQITHSGGLGLSQQLRRDLGRQAKLASAGHLKPTTATTGHPAGAHAAVAHSAAAHSAAIHPTAMHPVTVHPTSVHPAPLHPTTASPASALPRLPRWKL